MKPLRIIIGVLGSGAAFLGIFIFLVWRKRQLKNKVVHKNQRLTCQRKLLFNKVNDVNESPVETYDEASVESSQSFTSSITSLTSCEDNATAPSSDVNDSEYSSSGTDLRIHGATWVSTYREMPECRTMNTNLNDLSSSPVVAALFSDSRCPERSSSEDDSRPTSQNIVVEYEGQLTPKDVNQTVQNIGGTYNSIVSPLQPNTGTIISP